MTAKEHYRPGALGGPALGRGLFVVSLATIVACAGGAASTSAQQTGLAPISDDTIGRAVNDLARCVIEGGPIVTPEQMDQVCRAAGADSRRGRPA